VKQLLKLQNLQITPDSVTGFCITQERNTDKYGVLIGSARHIEVYLTQRVVCLKNGCSWLRIEPDSCESSGSVQGTNFLGQVKDSQLLHKNSAPIINSLQTYKQAAVTY
jgi:hypothetical protein